MEGCLTQGAPSGRSACCLVLRGCHREEIGDKCSSAMWVLSCFLLPPNPTSEEEGLLLVSLGACDSVEKH